jgi:zinc transporter ZupT
MRYALILAGSLMAGLLCAAVLVMAGSADANEAVVTGSLLRGFAGGWVLLAVLSAVSRIDRSGGQRCPPLRWRSRASPCWSPRQVRMR